MLEQPDTERVFDGDHAADWIAERTGIARETVVEVLQAETDYMVEHGFTEDDGEEG